ncbi:MAG TPA: hypothetical protein VGK81_02380, partial [Anaerolineae bacterium]
MVKRLTGIALAIAALALFVEALMIGRDWAENWGATAAEQSSPLPGDELIPPGSARATMGLTINTSADALWPWLAQFGAGRGGLYTYAWFEGLLNCPVTNAGQLLPDVPALRVGDQVRLCPDNFGPPPYTVATLTPGQSLVLGTRDAASATWVSTWQFVLLPLDGHTTRLLLRSGSTAPTAFDMLLGPGFFVMQRHMLQGFQERAEGMISPWYARDSELAFWLLAFVGFLVLAAATAVGHQPWLTSLLAIVAAALALLMIFAQP